MHLVRASPSHAHIALTIALTIAHIAHIARRHIAHRRHIALDCAVSLPEFISLPVDGRTGKHRVCIGCAKVTQCFLTKQVFNELAVPVYPAK